LNGSSALQESARKLAAVCGAPISSVPTLTDFIAGRNIPIPVAAPIGAPSKPAPVSVYIGAYDVVAAKDFDAVMRHVGDKVELVGQIVSVKQGIGKHGRGKGRPYVFINFGIWNQYSVKITIWSEGLGSMSTRPTEAWVGRWISATGLIEPPYDGKHYGRPYRNVGITVTSDNQIIQITEQDAKFRLGRGSATGARTTSGGATKPSNDDILKDILGRPGGGGTATGTYPRPTPMPTPVAFPKTKNEQILQTLRPSTGNVVPTPQPRPTYSPASQSILSRIPGWVWVIGGLLVLMFLAHK
jgi:hypothetical protein